MSRYTLKVHELLDQEGMTREEFLEEYGLESIVPGICMNVECHNVYHYEPDQTRGWCETCKDNSVKSGLIIMGVM
jgi:hypothetical protein